jgi:tripartite-type tricarboxylate transporter receptor subunit TctC
MEFDFFPAMNSRSLSLFARGLLLVALPLLQNVALAQSYPSRPIELVVPYAPGGASDIVARSIAPALQQQLGASVIISNRAGANTAIAATFVAHAAPDGYTLMLADVALLLNAAIHPGAVAYDPEKDFRPIAQLGTAPFVLFVPTSGSRTLADFLEKGKKNGLTIANAGSGSLGHLGAALLSLKTGVNIVNVPYKGSAPAITETLGGQVDATFGSTVSGMSYVQSRRLRVLAVAAPKRMDEFPDLPTFEQLGIEGVNVQNWWGVIGPAHMETAVVERLNDGLKTVAAIPAVRGRFVSLGISTTLRGPAEYADVMRQDLALWRNVVVASKIKVE